ncbi:DUF6867 family protein [Hyphomicrobium sp.]|uniref:DUF6867 family protein n=1 Tax=Hyphomicrobium sp. TaxID=82 RepID=UPI002E37DDCF|nr:hypothetical protein [Hyphomicrobium sp.]HEX2843175.1 hypothetical protein [Hyphomicrobium sp.]
MLEDFLTSLGYAPDAANASFSFVLLTLLIGGGAAWRTGQALSESWGPLWPVIGYTALLAAAIRFLHYSLFGGALLSFPSYLIDFAVLAVIALVAHRVRRARQMAEQYKWLFERAGPFSWRDRRP